MSRYCVSINGSASSSSVCETSGSAKIEMQDALERAHRRLIEPLPEEDRRIFIAQLHRLVEANNDVGRALLRNL
jgi:hypothetical protein